MRFAIFGLTVTSSWGNGHATTWRGLLAALREGGHEVTFFERDVPYYAAARDLPRPEWCELVLYREWDEALPAARAAIRDADVAMVTSFCPDGLAAAELVLASSAPVKAFYDIDTPVTLADLRAHGIASSSGVRYLAPAHIPRYDLYLSFTGGPVLRELRERWGARAVAALHCSVDPRIHRAVAPEAALRCALGYLGTYSADRQPPLERLLCEAARRRPDERFAVVGSQYPDTIAWPENVMRLDHLEPARHAAFYCSSRLTLNLTRSAMIDAGHSPSVRLFEAASCGVPIVTDAWPGLETFFEPAAEIVVARTVDDVLDALAMSDADLRRIAERARERVLREHTADVRARELVAACESVMARSVVA